jgi:hypothetical protein
LKAKSVAIVETPQAVVISSRASDFEQIGSITKEERKREASKPLYLIRYE